MKTTFFTLVLVVSSLGTLAVAQEQNQRNKYQPRRLDQIIKELSPSLDDLKENTSELLYRNGIPLRVSVTYLGKSRPTLPTRKEFMSLWSEAAELEDIQGLYQREYLFQEDSIEYWIPANNSIVERINQELKQQNKVEIFVVGIGARRVGGKADWIFLVNDFVKSVDPKFKP